jgi:hypothetical protein
MGDVRAQALHDDGCPPEQIGIIFHEFLFFRRRSIGKRQPCVKKNRDRNREFAETGMMIAWINAIKRNGGRAVYGQ